MAELGFVFAEAACVAVVHDRGLNSAQTLDWRRRIRAANCVFKRTKNSLARLAIDGTRFSNIAPMLNGPTGLAWSQDPVALAKVAVDFSRANDKLELVSISLGDQVLTLSQAKALSELPSLDVLRARLVGQLQTPATRLAVAMQAPGATMARLVSLAPGRVPTHRNEEAYPDVAGSPRVAGPNYSDADSDREYRDEPIAAHGAASRGVSTSETRRKHLQPSVGREEMVSAWLGLKSPSAKARETSIRTMVGFVRALGGTRVDDAKMAAVLRRAPGLVRSALMDPDPDVSRTAALALFGDGDLTADGWTEDRRRDLVGRIEEFLRRNDVGLMTLVQATTAGGAPEGNALFELSVEVTDTLSVNLNGLRAKVERPKWASGSLDLKVHVAVTGADWTILVDEDVKPIRGLVARRLVVSTHPSAARSLYVDPMLNDHLLGRRTFRVREIGPEPGYPLIT